MSLISTFTCTFMLADTFIQSDGQKCSDVSINKCPDADSLGDRLRMPSVVKLCWVL